MATLTLNQLLELSRTRRLHPEDDRDLTQVAKEPLRPSAVLVGLREQNNEPHLVLTRRTDHLKHHPGQICFPGGRYEPDRDHNLGQTVRREVEEELGIPAQHVELWQQLDRVNTITGFTITPYMGQLHSDAYQPCDDEVAEVLEVPMAFFLEPKHAKQEHITYRGKQHSYWTYQYENHRIWGATAKIINNLVARITLAIR